MCSNPLLTAKVGACYTFYMSMDWSAVGVVGAVGLHLGYFVYRWGGMNKEVERIGDALKNVEKDVKEIKEKVSECVERIATMEGRMQPYVMKGSPLSLTEKGLDLLECSGAREYIDKNKEGLLKSFEDIDKPFDIQEGAEKLMQEKLREDDGVKEYAFRNGERMEDISDVAGIALRDIVFEHKGIEV